MKAIYNGYKNAFLRNDALVEEKARKRLKICGVCQLKKVRAGVSVCGQCGCPLAALTRQDEKICSKWIGSMQ